MDSGRLCLVVFPMPAAGPRCPCPPSMGEAAAGKLPRVFRALLLEAHRLPLQAAPPGSSQDWPGPRIPRRSLPKLQWEEITPW